MLLAPILMLLAGRYVFRIDMTLASLRLLPPLCWPLTLESCSQRFFFIVPPRDF